MRKDFPVLNNNSKLIYLDSAATTLKPTVVIESLVNYYANIGANVHRGVYELSHKATELYEATRECVAKYINASFDEIIFTRGTTDSLNMFCQMVSCYLQPGDEIITSEAEHHSSYLPWVNLAKQKGLRITFAPLTKDGHITLENVAKVISNKTKVIALTHVSNVLGFTTPVKEICKLANKKGIITVIDGAQAAPHLRIDVKDLECSAYAFSAHKMLGPTGLGILYVKNPFLNTLPPVAFGGDMADIVTTGSSTYKDAPYRFEAGTPNIAGVIAFKEAINYLAEVDFAYLHAFELKLAKRLVQKLQAIPDCIIYNSQPESGIVTFNIKDIHPHDVVSILDYNGICLRAGSHCAQLIHNYLGMDSTLRASFYLYNTEEEVDILASKLTEIIAFFKG